ncbi:MAG: pilin [Thermoplasmata archaeon]
MYRAQTLKAKLSEVTNSMSSIATAVATYYQENNSWPATYANANDIGTNLGVYVPTNRATFSTGPGSSGGYVITATIQNISASNPQLDGDTITLTATTSAGGAITWEWGGTIDTAYLPKK